jgi:P-type conjugative transfer protein TrbJ
MATYSLMKTTLATLFIVVCAMRPASAQWTVACVNCGNEWTQIANYGQLAASYAKQAAQYTTQIQQYRAQLLHLKENPLSAALMVANLDALAGDAGRLLRNGRQIAGSMAEVNDNINRVFKNPQGDYTAKFRRWSEASTNALSNAMLRAGLQRERFADDTAAIKQLLAKNRASEGDLGAIKTLGEIGTAQLNESLKMRDLIAEQNTAVNTYLTSEAQKAQSIVDVNTNIMRMMQLPPPDPRNYTNIK